MLVYTLITLLSLYSVVSTYYCVRFAITVLRVQDSLQESLEVIEEKHMSISEILSRPLFYDSPEVRKVLKDIESTRDALEAVAYDLTDKIENQKEEEEVLNEG